MENEERELTEDSGLIEDSDAEEIVQEIDASEAEFEAEAETESEAGPEDLPAAGEAAAPAVSILTDPVTDFMCSNCGCHIDTTGLAAFTQIECPDCGAIEGVPARLGHFLLLKLLGMGGMGGVFYAKDETLGRFVAIKVMLQSLGDDAAFIETFRREAQAVAKLNHPNVAQIYSFGQEKGQPYIVMELVQGQHVDKMMDEAGGIPAPLAVDICFQVAQGLSAADEAGIVHGDIKPENILLDEKGRAKVVDFGLATVAHAAAEDGIWGTPYYIAPEKIRRQKVDSRADIYSLGATLYHILTGKPPFEGETPVEVVKARLEEPPPEIKEELPDLPAEVANLVTRMLATERTERYPTYKSLLSDMRKAVDAVGAIPRKSGPLGGKHIRIKKKGVSSPLSTTGADDGGASGGGRKNKIVIHKDRGAPAIAIKRSSQHLSGRIDMEDEPLDEPTPEELEAQRLVRKKRIKGVLTLITALLILGIIGGIAGFIAHRKKRIIAERAEYFAWNGAQKAAAEFYSEITVASSNVTALVGKTMGFESTIREAAEGITGQELVVPPLPPERVPEPVAKPEPEPEPDTEAAAEAAAEGEEDATGEDKGDDAAGEDDATEADEAEAEPEAEAAEEEVAEPEPEPDPEPEPEPEPEPVEEDLPPIMRSAREAVTNLLKLRRIDRNLKALIEPTDMADKAAKKSTHSREAKSAAAALEAMAKKATLGYEEARELYAAVRKQHADIVEEKQAFDAEMEAKRQAEIEEQRRLAEEAAEELKKKQREELAKTEVERSTVDKEEVAELFKKHDFDGVVAALEEKAKGYETDEGKAALQVFIDRYKLVATLKQELIAAITANPQPWGWGSGTSARDLAGASEKGISVVGTSATYPWKAVSVLQMLKFTDYYLKLPDVRIASKMRIAIGAAIYCDEFGEKGRAKAKTYLNRALDLGFPRREQERLIETGW